MKTTAQWLDAAKQMHSLSDYALAPKLGITKSQMSRYRTGVDFLSDDAAFKLAELLNIDPAQIIASAHAERAKSGQAKAFWMGWAERLAGVTAAVVMGVGLSSAPAPAEAATVANAADCILCQVPRSRRRRRNVFQDLLKINRFNGAF